MPSVEKNRPVTRAPRAIPAGFVSLSDAAERLCVHEQTARSMLARGELSGVRLAGRLLVTSASLKAFLGAAE